MRLSSITRTDVIAAMAECDTLGRDAFLANYGFKRAREYYVVYAGHAYDSKAIVGVAHKYAPGVGRALRSAEFSGGEATVMRVLEFLGFQMRIQGGGTRKSKRKRDWSPEEIAAVVEDHFVMLDEELRDERPNKAAHWRALLPRLDNRNMNAIRQKHCNISAILDEYGVPYISGYKPLPHYQRALRRAVVQKLAKLGLVKLRRREVPEPPPSAVPAIPDDPTSVVVEAPGGLGRGGRRAVKVRVAPPGSMAERARRNRALGRMGEEWVVSWERRRLEAANCGQLAEEVEWVSQTAGDGLGYDVYSYNSDGSPRHVEVKTTTQHVEAPFYITRNEVNFSTEHEKTYVLYRVFDFRRTPGLYLLPGAVEESCRLEPQSYKALPGSE